MTTPREERERGPSSSDYIRAQEIHVSGMHA